MTSAQARNATLGPALATLLFVLLPSLATAQTSWGIGVLQSGALVFCDQGRETVWLLTPTGQRQELGTGITCRTVVTNPDAVYGEATPNDVASTRGAGIWRVVATPTGGTLEWTLRPTMTPNGAWLIHDAQGNQYNWSGAGLGTPRSEIVRRTPFDINEVVAGSRWGAADGIGTQARLGKVNGFALAPDGSIVVADGRNIRRIDVNGYLRTEATGVITDSNIGLLNTTGLWGRELGVAAAPNGDAVIVDPAAGRIINVDRQGRATPIWEPAGFAQRISGGRWGWRPAGVAMLGTSYYALDVWMGPAILADLIGSPRLSQVDQTGHVVRIASVPNWMVRGAVASLMVALVAWMISRRSARATPR